MADLAFGNAIVQAAKRQLLLDGQPAKLGARAFDLLQALIERRDHVVSKNELLDLVWPDVVVEENNLQVQISTLRKLLGPTTIATIPGRGYRFTAPTSGAPEPATAVPTARPPGPESAVLPPGNLPGQLTPLQGRERECEELLGDIERHALVSIVGAAGIGKTALAVAVAHTLRDHYGDGAWLVELGSVADPGQVPQAVAQALRFSLGGAAPAPAELVAKLRSQSLLLVLDNCEHLVDAVAALAKSVLAQASGVRMIVTSQSVLNVVEERRFKLEPLAVPGPDDAPDPSRFGALRLFEARARAADPRFGLSGVNAEAVADICRQLDGVPLAIELAAARVRLLGVQGVRERLGERFRLLTGGARNALHRHQTLHAALDWSHALLSPEEQAVLRRLSVFVGGFTLELAQTMAADAQFDEWAVLDALSALVDKSLVAADAAEPPRYRLLESTRAYALEKLAQAGEMACVRERHARAVRDLFVQTEEARFGEQGQLDMNSFLQRLAPELENLRAALDWAAAAPDEPGRGEIGVALAAASAEALRTLGLSHEALRAMLVWQYRVDERLSPQQQALYWHRLATLGHFGRLPKARLIDAAARAQAIYRETGSRRRLYRSLCGAAWALNMTDQFDEAGALMPELLALESPDWPGFLRSQRLNVHAAVCINQERYEQGLALLTEQRALLEQAVGEEALLLNGLNNMCLALVSSQRYEDALALALEIVHRRAGELGNKRGDKRGAGEAWAHATASLVFLGRSAEAEQAMHDAMSAWRRDGLLFYVSGLLALLLAELGRWADAARVDGAALAFLQRSGVAEHRLMKRTRARLEQVFAAAAVPPEELQRWRREGEALDEAALAELCLRRGPG